MSGLVENNELFQPGIRIFLMVGLLGAFTNFSTFGYERFFSLIDPVLSEGLVTIEKARMKFYHV